MHTNGHIKEGDLRSEAWRGQETTPHQDATSRGHIKGTALGLTASGGVYEPPECVDGVCQRGVIHIPVKHDAQGGGIVREGAHPFAQ